MLDPTMSSEYAAGGAAGGYSKPGSIPGSPRPLMGAPARALRTGRGSFLVDPATVGSLGLLRPTTPAKVQHSALASHNDATYFEVRVCARVCAPHRPRVQLAPCDSRPRV